MPNKTVRPEEKDSGIAQNSRGYGRFRRVFIIVLDSFGVGAAPDAADFGDAGSSTVAAVMKHPAFDCPNLGRLGLFHIDGVGGPLKHGRPRGTYCRLQELSAGKDTTTGHWEIAGLVSKEPMPTYPQGFPPEVISEFERLTGRRVLCNRPYSGTEVIRDYGPEHIRTGALIVYTSADSVFQIAAHKSVVPVPELYRICETARGILTGKHGVGRVIARPFDGEFPYFRTPERHDFSILPPSETMLDRLAEAGRDVISVGKIYDIFAGRGIKESECNRTVSNSDGMDKTLKLAGRDFNGLCFVNLVEFDSTYGHRNDTAGYAAALTDFDRRLGELLPLLRRDDMLIITADHGCDPSTPSTDHSREYVPFIAAGPHVAKGRNLGTRTGFCDISATVIDALGADPGSTAGSSMLDRIYVPRPLSVV